jgi:hypothetical protein
MLIMLIKLEKAEVGGLQRRLNNDETLLFHSYPLRSLSSVMADDMIL